MPYTFTLPGFFPVQNLDEYGRALLRKGFGGFGGLRGGPRGPPVGNNLLDQLFPSGFGGPSRGPSRVPRREPRDDTGSIGGISNTTDRDSGTKGSISSLPKIKETAGRPAQLTYRLDTTIPGNSIDQK